MRPRNHSGSLYAVAAREGANLFVCLIVRRAPSGDIYIIQPRSSEPGLNAHVSLHATGQYHFKSFDHIVNLVVPRQKPDASFRGAENLLVSPIARDEPRRWNIPCQTTRFREVMEIPSDSLRPERYATLISVDVTQAKPVKISAAGIVRQTACFRDAVPWIVVTLYETDYPVLK